MAGTNTQESQNAWNTRISESGFNSESFFTNANIVIGRKTLDQQSSTNELAINGEATFASNRHSIYSKPDTGLTHGEIASFFAGVVNEDGTSEAAVIEHGATIDNRPIDITNFDVSADLSAPGSERALTELHVLNGEQFALVPLQPFLRLVSQRDRLVEPSTFFDATASLSQGEDQQGQSVLQHSPSFGTPTLPPDRDLINHAEGLNTSVLFAEQLALLNQATITIADLADGYLALTLGNTITLDTDAAGYGWFIDPTPWANEEFIPNSSLITDHASPWQLQAAPGSAAEGKIDLMTVLMHELGHVMGLDHVSSAVDGTRLMAGSIDPGIRRLPSALDLGAVASSTEPGTGTDVVGASPQSVDSSIWDPYLAHDTTLSSGESAPAPVVNPASLVQAAQVPSHSGIFNSNFAIADPANAHFGWDSSGAVTIANGQAVLSEDSNVISTLSQLFTVPAGPTHLRFTLLDANLISNGVNRPPDAFEVALLEASTLTPLAGVTAGLTQTDSLFNLQQDGTVRFSNRVSLSTGALSGSTLDLTQPVIVDIDLTGITAGAGARLSFDLLGFGDRTSTIVLDNVLLTNGQPTAAPVAVNDAYTVAEGATVTLTITPTNDAPMAAQTVEQGRTLTVHVVVTDPDDSNSAPESTVLTYRFAPGVPSGASIDANTGVLSWAAPRTQTVGRYTMAVIVTDAGTPALSATRSVTVDVLELSNTTPTLDPIGPKTVNEESEIRFTIHGSDADVPTQTLVYRATGLPAEATFNATTRGASAELTVRLVPDKVTHLAGRCRDGLTSDLDAHTADGLSLDRARPYRVPRSLAG